MKTGLKILAIHSIGWGDTERESAVDIWRIWRPMRELAKHTDWQIDHQPTFIKGIEKYKDEKEFTEEELEKAAEHLGKYDIVFSSYFPDHTPYTLMKVVEKRYGTKFVLDVDDNMFAIAEDNPFWTKVKDKQVWWMQNIIKDVDNMIVTTDRLAEEFDKRREHHRDSITVIPNMISKDYKHPKLNHKGVNIGYFGGASHMRDLNETQCVEAVAKLMHKYRDVTFKTVNMPIAEYIPVKRYTYDTGARGTPWITKIFPTLELDIALIPLLDNDFNMCKSDIKWQEATQAGATTIVSNVPPYTDIDDDACVKVNNDYDDWYNAIEELILDKKRRQEIQKIAKSKLNYIEDNWQLYKEYFESL